MIKKLIETYVFKICFILVFDIILLVNISSRSWGEGLEIIENSSNPAFLVYKGKPILAYGPSPQKILTYLPRGNGNDLRDWIEWAKEFGFSNVRSYPPSISVDEPALNVFQKSTHNAKKFDLNVFNEEYFKELRKACKLLKLHGVIIHLQLWQAVYWKKSWEKCYYNPKNNINPDISAHAGPGEFVTLKNSVLLEHQKKYVQKILDATGDLGNVFYDIMNEIGNGTGTNKEWVKEIIKTINYWEREHNIDLLLTLNDEGGKRMGNFSLECDGLDLIVKDLGRYDEHVETKLEYRKPTVSVRNIDYDYEKNRRFYFFGRHNLEINTDPNLQTRGRKYWWRMFMSGVQIAGGYADSYIERGFSWFVNKVCRRLGFPRIFSLERKSSYRLNQLSEKNFLYFRQFIDKISDYKDLVSSSGVLIGHPVPNSYCLQSMKQSVIYLESPNGSAGFNYDQRHARLAGLKLINGIYRGIYYFPANGQTREFTIQISSGDGKLLVPPFEDDLAIIIQQ